MNTNHNGIMIYGQYRLLCMIPDPATSKSDRDGNSAHLLKMLRAGLT
jgi:hypothetical protein